MCAIIDKDVKGSGEGDVKLLQPKFSHCRAQNLCVPALLESITIKIQAAFITISAPPFIQSHISQFSKSPWWMKSLSLTTFKLLVYLHSRCNKKKATLEFPFSISLASKGNLYQFRKSSHFMWLWVEKKETSR